MNTRLRLLRPKTSFPRLAARIASAGVVVGRRYAETWARGRRARVRAAWAGAWAAAGHPSGHSPQLKMLGRVVPAAENREVLDRVLPPLTDGLFDMGMQPPALRAA